MTRAPPALATLLVVSAGCADLVGPDAGRIVDVDVRAPVPLTRVISVTLDRPAPVQIDYRTSMGPSLRVASPEVRTDHELTLTRLWAERRYEFEVSAGGAPEAGEFVTDPLPDDLRTITFTTSGQSTLPLTLVELAPFPFDRADSWRGAVIVDEAGRVVWFFRGAVTGATRRTNGNFVLLDGERGLVEVRPSGEEVAILPQETDGRTMHHDVVASDEQVLFLALDRQLFNDTLVSGESVWEWDPNTGEEQKRWSSFDHFTPDVDRGPRYSAGDWLHANSLSVGPRGNAVVSLHFLNQIVSIAPDYSTIEWRLGGTNATVQVPDEDRFSGQHTAVELTPGRVLMFDNGFERMAGSSRALELELNGTTAEKAWEYVPTPANWSAAISSARRLENGNTLVGFGMSEGLAGSTGPIEVHEVTPDGTVVWRMVVDGVQLMYRATPLQSIGDEVERDSSTDS